MSIKINPQVCTGCPKASEPPCVRICPGDLITKNHENAEIREPQDCWDCGACLKICPNQAIAMYLPVQIGGKGATLVAKNSRDKIIWTCKWPDGKQEIFEVEAERIV